MPEAKSVHVIKEQKSMKREKAEGWTLEFNAELNFEEEKYSVSDDNDWMVCCVSSSDSTITGA